MKKFVKNCGFYLDHENKNHMKFITDFAFSC